MKFLFVAIPEDLAPRLERLFGEPQAWWLGQVEKYLFRLTGETDQHIKKIAEDLGFKNPIVGVHIRRTDKIKEAAYQPVEAYMEEVDDYFDQLELTGPIVRRIFLSTEEPDIIKEVREKYPHYQVLADESAARESRLLESRLKSSLGILTDARLLSQCDYFVGTFSSNVGRRVYEFMFWNHADAGERYKSLDDRHFEVCENPQICRAVVKHVPRDSTEMAMEVGQEFELLYQYNPMDVNGVTKVRHRQDRSEGYVPSFKVEKVIETADFPTYPEAL
jgi:glycoprotein 6-alpha-L-fucosyltransferase